MERTADISIFLIDAVFLFCFPGVWYAAAPDPLMFSFTEFFNHHGTLAAVRRWTEGWGSDEAALHLRDVTSHGYALTQLLNNLMINILLNYMAFSTRAGRPHSSPLVNTEANEGSMARKKAFTALVVLINNKTTAKVQNTCILIMFNNTTGINLGGTDDKIPC